MKEQLEQHLAQALAVLQANGTVPPTVTPSIAVTRTRDASHGDFASNLALMLAKPARRSPRDVAQALIDALPESDAVREVTIAGPGFINFFQAEAAQNAVVATVLNAGKFYGRSEFGAGKQIHVEYVSANPTGPLSVGHGRGAALGASIANLLNEVGFDVQREYNVKETGRQIDILATSVWLRYLKLLGETFDFPSNGYRGEHILEISQVLLDEVGERYRHSADAVFDGIVADEAAGGDKVKHIDGLIDRAHRLLGNDDYRQVFDRALEIILDTIKEDLREFGVEFDQGFSERSLSDDVQRVLDKLDASGHVYEKEGVRWFRSTDFGDDKDRPLVRANGLTSCFASDIACIDNKLQRGCVQLLYILGAERYGNTARMQAACEALGYPPERLKFVLIQSVSLFKGGERVQMTTRSGLFVSIRELIDEVGRDAARYFYVMRKNSQHLDFDLDLATSQSNDNPVYYVQYAYARICSVMRQLAQRQLKFDRASGLAALSRLNASAETELIALLASYPELIQRAAVAQEPSQLTRYLRDLANGLNSYYSTHKVLVDDGELRHARLCLILAVQQVLANGLALIDVSTPEVM